jgi:hypothetical protein
LTGGEGVKEILQTTLLERIVDKVALKQLNQTGATAIIKETLSKSLSAKVVTRRCFESRRDRKEYFP